MKPQFFWIACIIGSCLLSSCVVPVNSFMEGARTLGEGKVELTGSYARYSVTDDGETEDANQNLGLRLGVGLSERFDLKLRYVRLFSSFEDSPDVNYLALAPKLSLIEKRLALSAPTGLYFASDDGESESTFFISPRIIFSIVSPNDQTELSISSKVDFYFEEDAKPYIGFNLGGGFSSDLDRWAIRPEVGYMISTERGSSGAVLTFGVGLTKTLNDQ